MSQRDKDNVSLYLHVERYKEARAKAQREGTSLSKLINRWIAEYLGVSDE